MLRMVLFMVQLLLIKPYKIFMSIGKQFNKGKHHELCCTINFQDVIIMF